MVMKHSSSDAELAAVLPMAASAGPAAPVRPSQSDAEAAMRTLLAWFGDDPDRPGLEGTPTRVATAFPELFAGYRTDPVALLKRSMMPNHGAGQLIMLRAIRMVSFCERHFLPIVGQVHVGYVPRHYAVGIGAIAQVVDAAAKRLQVQEQITDDITRPIMEALDPEGLAVVVEAEHLCMSARGVAKASARFVSSRQLGCLAADSGRGQAFLNLVTGSGSTAFGACC